MDSTTPFQPWTTNDGAINVKNEKDLMDDAKTHRENVNHPKHIQTASQDKERVVASTSAPGPAAATETDAARQQATERGMDATKIASMQQIVENTLGAEGRQRVGKVLEAVEALSGAERLLLYLRLPTGSPPHDPLKQPLNPLGSRSELQQTVMWIQTHLEVDPEVSLPKQDVYDEYIAFCMSSNMKPLSTADFGKVMKQVYPTVRPRRLGTRGNSRYCYAGLRKKIKLEVPQLPDLGGASSQLQEAEPLAAGSERLVCEWAENIIGMKFGGLSELAQHLAAVGSVGSPAGPSSPPPPPPHPPHHGGSSEEAASRHLLKQLKRKIQTQSTPARPKKNKSQDIADSPPSTSNPVARAVKLEGERTGDPSYAFTSSYMPPYDARAPFSPYGAPPRAHPPHLLPTTHPVMPAHDYRDPYAFESSSYAPRDLSLPAAHNLPINLSSDASLDLSTERAEWTRRRPPEPPPARLPLPGKKMILEAYNNETQGNSPRAPPLELRPNAPELRPAPVVLEDFPRAEYLPKKFRAAEILGGKLAATRQALSAASSTLPSTSQSTSVSEHSNQPETFLESSKNLANRSKSIAAALVRGERDIEGPTQAVQTPTPRPIRGRPRKNVLRVTRTKRGNSPERADTPESCCLDGINIKTGVICAEKHAEILNRERVISICNMDKHALDDYLNEGSSQEHEEELLQYFQRGRSDQGAVETARTDAPESKSSFLDSSLDPQDDHSQGKNEKISQLRELLAKNLKSQSGSSTQNVSSTGQVSHQSQNTIGDRQPQNVATNEGEFKRISGHNVPSDSVSGIMPQNTADVTNKQSVLQLPNKQHTYQLSNMHSEQSMHDNLHYSNGPTYSSSVSGNPDVNHYNGNSNNVPQSPTTRTQQYDFVPISPGCNSPRNSVAKSPTVYSQRGQSPTKLKRQMTVEGPLQTSPVSHSTAASPFVSPRNTPVPRSRHCPRPIPKVNGRKKNVQNNLLALGIADSYNKQMGFAMPIDHNVMMKSPIYGPRTKYYQQMSAPPSPNILNSRFKSQFHHGPYGVPNGNGSPNLSLNFFQNPCYQESANGDISQPLSADPLASEVSQFFQESFGPYRSEHETFRSQSVPLKQGMGCTGLLSYNNTPVGSIPPTPVPHEYSDFGSLGDTIGDISRAGLNPETLDKIYDALDSTAPEVLDPGALHKPMTDDMLQQPHSLTNGCNRPEQEILTDEQFTSLIPTGSDLIERPNQFEQSFGEGDGGQNDVDEFLKRTNSLEFDLSDLVMDKSKYYTSRSVPSTPLPYKRLAPSLQLDTRRPREIFLLDSYSNLTNGITSKSVPSTPQLPDDRNVFSYSNRDFLINGNSVESGVNGGPRGAVVDSEGLGSPLHHILQEEILEPLTPAADLLADLDKIDGPPYTDL